MMNPAHPTEKYILGRIAFHEDQAYWFAIRRQSTLAKWAESIAAEWKKKLEALIK